MTLQDIEQDVYRRMGKDTASVDTATQTRIRAFVNQRIRELLTLPDCSELRDLETTFNSVAGTATVDLPVTIQRINRVIDKTNEIVLTEKTLAWYRLVSPDPASHEGTPEAFVPFGLVKTSADVFKHRIALWPTPSAILTYTVDYTSQWSDLSSATDVPPIPEDFHRLIIYGACIDECLKTDDSRYATYKAEWAQGVADLKYWMHARPSYRPGASRASRGSNLGAWFPAGRW
jgi:hypothetical protein